MIRFVVAPRPRGAKRSCWLHAAVPGLCSSILLFDRLALAPFKKTPSPTMRSDFLE